MTQLLTQYSLSEIILFIVILAIAVKSFVQFIDWARKRTVKAVEENQQPLQLAKKHDKQLKEIKEQLESLKQSINLLIDSDKDDIKQSITQSHHYFCYKLKSIDDYSLDCIEKRYSHYKDQGGNSFIKTLMQEMRALPRKIEMDNR